MTEAEQEAFELDENDPPEADPKTEFDFQQELDLNKLQVQQEGRQLGYLLVMKTKGETQLQIRRWIQSSNGWEAWRQLNLLHSTSKRSTHFKLLPSLMSPTFDTQPASFLQQYNAWKEQIVRYQQLSGENLPDFIKLTAVVNGLKGPVRHHVLMQLDGGSSFGVLDNLLQKYFNNTYVQSESSLNSVWDKAWRDNQAKEKSKSKGKGKKLSNPHYKEDKGKGKGKPKGKGKGKPNKRGSLPIPAHLEQRQGKATASQKPTMVQHMLQKGASCTSLLVESGILPAAAITAPERSSLANKRPATTSLGSATLASANFFSVAWRQSSCAMARRTSASALQLESTSHLH